ncbi:capsid protein [Enterobacteria phage C-1 INW-2012]|uniref:Capsid protein n=1 Tax=Enterobacteria phage C-1 INW-2012 TaxID=1206313 RepID=I6WIS3_9VIRU|nr:capsid protein [Enterobacteria phage C-1 INW-2012]AFN37813.1 capsid protein [Enterobacteria phage C-1 INW-2012]
MPQLQTLVLKDRAATPVNHTFAPRDITNNVGKVVESSGVPVGEKTYTISVRQTPENGRFRVQLRMAVPTVQNQDVGGIINPIVTRTAYVDATFTFDRTSTEQERKDIVGMFQDSLDPSKALVNGALINLEGVY